MADAQAPLPFSQAVPKAPLEPDRHAIENEMQIIITGVILSDKTRYGNIAKINGLVDGKETKWYTTSEVIVHHCEDLITHVGTDGGSLKRAVSARIYWRTSAKGQKYLDME
ncbi:MAG: hypothetical protein WC455_25185 [Dehalococcoidia bacterium]